MSDTESFESVYERLYPQLHNPCGLWKAATIAEWLDDLERAHDREIRDVSQQQYDRGYHDGTHSMDAEHRAIAMRLRALPLDGGSHENLSQIARAIYHSDFGWTQGACASLRDELVRLMGGVSDGTAEPMTTDELIEYINQDTRRLKGDASKAGDGDDTCDSQCCGACAAGDGGDSGEQEVTDERLADDCGADSRGGDGGGDLHMAGVTYDVLDNERRKAVCELRKMTIDSDYHGNYQRIALAIGTVYDGESFASECVRDRLIHLLGGDQPSGIDVLRAMDGESDADGTCPNDDQTPSITDELRKWADGDVWSCKWEEFKAIADRIDEQFDRICWQQEAVLQSTIDGMVKEYEHDRESERLRIEKLEKQRDEARAERDELSDELLRVRRDRDEMRAKMAIIREAVDG